MHDRTSTHHEGASGQRPQRPPGRRTRDVAIDDLPVGIVEVDAADGRIRSANQAFAALLNATGPDQVEGRQLTDIAIDGAAAQQWIDQAMKSSQPLDMVLDLQSVDGRVRHLRMIRQGIQRGDGHVVAVVEEPTIGGNDDGAPRPALHRGEEWSRSIVDAANNAGIGLAINVVDPDGTMHLEYVNRAGAEILGQSAPRMRGGTPVPRLDAELAHRWRTALAQGERIGSVLRDEIHPDGQRRRIEYNLSSGSYWGRQAVLCFFRDVSDRQGVEDELHAAMARLETVLEECPLVVFSVDGDGRIEWAQGQALASLALTPEAIIEEDLLGAHDAPDLRRLVKDALQGERASGVVHFEDRAFEVHMRPVNANGTRAIGVAMDVTDIMHLQRQVQRHEVEALKAAIINEAAHVLRTPMTPMLLQLDLLIKDAEDNMTQSQMRKLKVLARNAHRFHRTVESILCVADLLKGRRHRTRSEQPVLPVVKQAVRSTAALGELAGVRIELDIAPGLRGGVDSMTLPHAVSALLHNAINASGDGDVITVRGRRREGGIELTVRDDGRGIQRERLASLQDYLHDPEANQDGGHTFGGLALARAVMQAHEGHVHLASDGRGQGCAARLWIPDP